MKVAIIHMRVTLKGGLETRLFNYVDYFLKRGDEVAVITYKVNPDVSLPAGVKLFRVNLSAVPKPFRLFSFTRGTDKILKWEGFDFALSMGRTWCQDYLIAPNTHKGYLLAQNKKLLGLSDWLQLYMDRKSFARARCIYACSDMVRQEIIQLYGVREEKVKVLYPPVNTTIFNQKEAFYQYELKKQFGLDPDKKVFAFVSTSHRRKGIDLLLKVFEALENQPVQLAVAGSSADFGRSNIRSLGFVKNVKQLYQAADFTIHPAIYEPFGQIVTESLCCGKPVLVGQKVGAKEIVSPKEGIVVEDYSVEKWVAAVKQAIEGGFNIAPDFAEQKELTLEHHMQKMLSVLRG